MNCTVKIMSLYSLSFLNDVEHIGIYWFDHHTPSWLRHSHHGVHFTLLVEHLCTCSLQWRHNECNGVSNHQPQIVYSTVYSGADQRKHESSASMAFVQGIHRWPVNSPHKGPVMQKLCLFDDIIMCCGNSAGVQTDWYWMLNWSLHACIYRWVGARKT